MSHYRSSRAWRDELGELLARQFKGTRISVNTTEGTEDFADSCVVADDYVIMNVQMNHDKDLTADLHPHLHWFQASANVPNWWLAYRWQSNGQAKTVAWTPLAYTGNVFAYAGGTLVQITEFPAITPPVGAGLSDIIQIKLSRDTGNVSGLFTGLDPLVGDASALMFDIHFELDTVGSISEYEK